MTLYDTMTRSKREFVPIDPPIVRMYCCGLTVYNYAHIGNLRTYIFEDLLRRTLLFNGYKVHHVQNVTDVGPLALAVLANLAKLYGILLLSPL